VRRPIRFLMTGDLEFGDGQGAVPVQTNILGLRGAKQDVVPRSGLDWHPQAANAGAAAVTLIPNDGPDQANSEQPVEHHCKGVPQIVRERVWANIQESFWNRQHVPQRQAKPVQQSAGDHQLRYQKAPVLHMVLDTGTHRLVAVAKDSLTQISHRCG